MYKISRFLNVCFGGDLRFNHSCVTLKRSEKKNKNEEPNNNPHVASAEFHIELFLTKNQLSHSDVFMSRFWFSLDVFVEFMDSVTKIELFVVAVKWLEPAQWDTLAKDRIFKLSPLSLN